VQRLAAAMAGSPWVLHVVGVLSADQRTSLEQSGISYRSSPSLTEEELVAAYRAADVVAFASTYEGFGLPIVEGQAIGRVVVTSNLSPMSDVAGNGACFVDPYDVQSIKKGLEQVIGDEAYRRQLIANGFSNVERFAARRIADMYAEAYRELSR
jgi:glycosyltransferase involved in cell wall biosynthesis